MVVGQDGRSGPVEILVGRQSDGSSYSLHPNSLKLIRQRFPQIHPRPTVFIGSDTKVDMEANLGVDLQPTRRPLNRAVSAATGRTRRLPGCRSDHRLGPLPGRSGCQLAVVPSAAWLTRIRRAVGVCLLLLR